MFFEGLQSYYAPVVTLAVFAVILFTDKLFSRYIKTLFLVEALIIAVIIIATWADRCLSVMDLGGAAWQFRTATTFTNFALSPLSPMILGLIYNKNGETHVPKIYYVPAGVNFLLCAASIFTGWVFNINSQNVYTRGPLFAVPFIVSGFYLLAMLLFTLRQTNMPSRKAEALYLAAIMLVTGIASLLEVIFVIRFIIWSTTEITVILYFLLLTTQKILYDPLTGIFSRVAYTKKLENIEGRKCGCTIAMIDMNGLKHINDTHGHDAGNRALISMTESILRAKSKSMLFYRYAGDEFAIIDKAGMKDKIEEVLAAAQKSCEPVKGEKVSFAYGIAECHQSEDIHHTINWADHAMYRQKKQMKGEAEEEK